MEFRGRYIGAPRIVEQVTVHRYNAIEDLREVAVLNDDFEAVPLASELGSTFWCGVDVVQISSAVFVDGRIGVAFCRVCSII